MAYIKKEDSKAIREALKKEFPGSKFGVKIRHHSSLSVDIKARYIYNLNQMKDWISMFLMLQRQFKERYWEK